MADLIKPLLDIDINNIFYLLHEVALELALAALPDIKLINIGVDYKNKTFVGSGEFLILTELDPEMKYADAHNNPDYEDDLLKKCHTATSKYVDFFVKAGTSSQLSPEKDYGKVLKLKSIHDSFDFKKSLLDNLIVEADDKVNLTIGYSLPYELDIQGQKKHDIIENIKRVINNGIKSVILNSIKLGICTIGFSFWKGIASGLGKFAKGFLDDITNILLKTGSGSFGVKGIADITKDVLSNLWKGGKDFIVTIGKKVGQEVLDGYKRIFGKVELDDLAIQIKKAFNDKYEQNIVDVRVFLTDTLFTNLRKLKKMSSELEDKLLKNGIINKVTDGLVNRMEYCIVVLVNPKDEHYELYNIDEMQEMFTAGMKKASGPFIINSISKDNIVKINEYTTHLVPSKYRQPRLLVNSSMNSTYDLMNLIFESTDSLLLEATVAEIKSELADMFSSDAKARYLMMKALSDPFFEDADVAIRSISTKKDFINALKRAYATKDPSTGKTLVEAFFNKYTGAPVVSKLNIIYKNFKSYSDEYDSAQNPEDNTENVNDLYLFLLPNLTHGELDSSSNSLSTNTSSQSKKDK